MNDRALYERDACAALLITCSDFRFKRAEREFVRTAGLLDDFDLIARPGGIRSLVAPRTPGARESMEEEIALLSTLHRFSRVVMLNHLSCRAYDDLTADAGDEREVHVAHLREAAARVEERLEGVTAEPHLIAPVYGVLRVERVRRE